MSAVIDQKLLVNSMSVASQFLDPVTGKYKVRGLCEALTLTRKDLATVTGKPPQFFQEYWSGKFVCPTEPVVKETVEQLLLVYVLVSNLCKEQAQIRLWMRLPNPGFDNRSPANLIVDGKLAVVRDTLVNLMNGATPA